MVTHLSFTIGCQRKKKSTMLEILSLLKKGVPISKSKINVLMYGWEFPPHISGGLGVACHDLTRSLYDIGADMCGSPRQGNEACGTSGMKACINGVLHVSGADGWWHEAPRRNWLDDSVFRSPIH